MPHGELARHVIDSGALAENVPGRMIARILRRLGIVAMLQEGALDYGEVLRRVHAWRVENATRRLRLAETSVPETTGESI